MHSPSSVTHAQRLGVAWVLRQAAVLAVLSLTAVHVAGVACLASAERQLLHAAETSVAEALLPPPSLQRVRHRAVRLLQSAGVDTSAVSVAVHCNGKVVDGVSRLCPGDEVLLTLTAPSRSALPSGIARLAPWLANEDLVGRAKATLP